MNDIDVALKIRDLEHENETLKKELSTLRKRLDHYFSEMELVEQRVKKRSRLFVVLLIVLGFFTVVSLLMWESVSVRM